MPTRLKRYAVTLPNVILQELRKECERTSEPSVGRKILSILAERYQMRVSQPIIFGRQGPLEVELQRERPLIFRASDPQLPAPALNRRASQGRGRS